VKVKLLHINPLLAHFVLNKKRKQ